MDRTALGECQLSGVIPVCMVRPARGSWPYRSGPRASADRRHPRPAVPTEAPVGQRRDAEDGARSRASPVLVEFWDFCRVNSLRTLPYVAAWHERYRDDGLRVIGVHSGGFPPSRGHRRGARRVRADGDRAPGRDRRALADLEPLRQPGLARALPLEPAGLPARLPLRRGRLRRDRAGDPGAARGRARARGAGAPRGRAGRDAARADRGPAGRLLRALRGGRRLGRRLGPRRRCAPTAPSCRSTTPAACRSSSTPTTPRA